MMALRDLWARRQHGERWGWRVVSDEARPLESSRHRETSDQRERREARGYATYSLRSDH